MGIVNKTTISPKEVSVVTKILDMKILLAE